MLDHHYYAMATLHYGNANHLVCFVSRPSSRQKRSPPPVARVPPCTLPDAFQGHPRHRVDLEGRSFVHNRTKQNTTVIKHGHGRLRLYIPKNKRHTRHSSDGMITRKNAIKIHRDKKKRQRRGQRRAPLLLHQQRRDPTPCLQTAPTLDHEVNR